MFRFEDNVYVEASNAKKSWNKIWPEQWNTSTREKWRYSSKISVPVVPVNEFLLFLPSGSPIPGIYFLPNFYSPVRVSSIGNYSQLKVRPDYVIWRVE